jgi:hypothetical protein
MMPKFIDDVGRVGLARVDRIPQQLSTVGQLRRQLREPFAERFGPRVQTLQRHSLQFVIGEVVHDRNGLLDGLGIAACFFGRCRCQRKIIGVGGDQHCRKGLTGFAERRPDQRIAVAGRALDDRIKPGHVAGGRKDFLLIGLRDRRLHFAQFAEAVEEALGDLLKLLHRTGKHRVGRGACLQRPEHGFAQMRNLVGKFGTRLVDVTMNQVLQMTGFAFERGEDPLGIAHLPDIVPGRSQYLDAIPDQGHQHDDDGGIQRGDRQDAPADRHRADHRDQTRVAARRKARWRFRGVVLVGDLVQFN